MSRNVLALEKFRTDFGNIELSAVRLKDSINACFDDFEVISKEKGVKLECKCNGDYEVLANKLAFESHVLANLISNAIKYSPENSTVKVTTIADEKYIEVIVADEGAGVPLSQVDKLFTKQKVKSKLGTKAEIGSGVGLSMVKMFMDSFKGEVFYRESSAAAVFVLRLKRFT